MARLFSQLAYLNNFDHSNFGRFFQSPLWYA